MEYVLDQGKMQGWQILPFTPRRPKSLLDRPRRRHQQRSGPARWIAYAKGRQPFYIVPAVLHDAPIPRHSQFPQQHRSRRTRVERPVIPRCLQQTVIKRPRMVKLQSANARCAIEHCLDQRFEQAVGRASVTAAFR